MNQGLNDSTNNKNDINSIFKNKPKPISYVKGDLAYIAEISEESLVIKNKGTSITTITRNEISVNRNSERNGSKKGLSDDSVYRERQIKIDIQKDHPNGESEMKKYPSGNQTKFNDAKERVPDSNFDLNTKQNGVDNRNFDTEKNTKLEINGKSEDGVEEKSLVLKKSQSLHFLPIYIEKGITPYDDTDQNIYSWTNLHLFSFLTGAKSVKHNSKNNHLNYPSPTFIDTKEWQIKPILTKQIILEGMIIDDKRGLVLVDRNIMKKFRGIISDMIKQILAVWLRPISLKVGLFEPKSTLHRITDYWSFAPQFLNKAALADSPLERMKYVIAFAVSGFYIPTKQLKPFNPLIGETFQGEFENGAKVYVEHISHYPNHARFLITDENYKIHGYFDFNAKTESLTGSKISVTQQGPITIEFLKTKETLVYNMPCIKLLNASSEEGRSAIWTGVIVFSDVKNNLQAFTQFANDDKYIHGFNGLIYEQQYSNGVYNHYEYVKKCEGFKNWINKPHNYINTKILGHIRGSWLSNLKIDEELLWDINTHIPNWIRPSMNAIPSDGRYREDLIWLYRSFTSTQESQKTKYEEYAQGWKVAIEQVQRAEREIKKKNRKKKK